MPKVSICIPTYNTARYISETIESVLAQCYQDYELVICDNASTDETPELVQRYNDSRIRYLRFEELTNQSGNFNRCLQAARGEYITLLHSDDFFLPGFISHRVSLLANNPEVGFVFGAVQMVDAAGEGLSVSRRWDEDHLFKCGELVEFLLLGCIVCPPSLMVRKTCADKTGLFRTDLTWGHDWEWAIRLAENNGCFFSSVPMAAYRVHDVSGTAEILNSAKNGKQEKQILDESLNRLSETGGNYPQLRKAAFGALSRRHMFFAEQALLAGRHSVTRHNLYYAIWADKSMSVRPTLWALLLGSLGSVQLYSAYSKLRKPASIPESINR
ncbi:MAG: glycosyltransferase [Acidobacteria bacterium]|nr:glycosyltransferase [Acidobacteriota bacterium]